MVYSLVKVFSFIVSTLPSPVRRMLGNLVGEICWPLVPEKRKRLAIDNIKQGFAISESQAKIIAKQSTTRFGRMFMEVLAFPRINKNNIAKHVHMEGAEHLTEALAQGRGVVLATAHSGNWELLGAALAMNGFPLAAVVQKQTNAAMDRFINEYRRLVGMHITYKSSALEMARLLGQGKVIGILMDQDAHSGGVFVDFFGRPASTPQGSAVLARMKDSPIVPAFITENSDGTHTAIIHPYIMPEKTKDKAQDVQATTAKLTKIIEQHVRQHPTEWFWLHNRWKTKPPQK
ncbi:MAG: lysophospholipid acyltransferase family protein [Negativicutes bacterium]|jgi:KDO2-lipid IV(A) lauroyltransferase